MDGQGWDAYYSANAEPWTRPDDDLQREVAGLKPGRAIDLGAGEGADALWLAGRGWQVTAVDYAEAAIATVQRLAHERGLEVTGRVADVTDLQLQPTHDLVTICYLHMSAEPRARLLHAAVSGLAPGGTLLYIGIARGPGGSDIPGEVLATPEKIVEQLEGLEIERADRRYREVGCPEGGFEAEVMVVRARRPA